MASRYPFQRWKLTAAIFRLPLTAIIAWMAWLYWSWFAAPLGAPRLGYPTVGLIALGAMALVLLLDRGAEEDQPDNAVVASVMFVASAIAVALIAGVGWAAHVLIGWAARA